MKLKNIYIAIITLVLLCLIPPIAGATKVIGSWVTQPWQPEGMISWGTDDVLVDFGPNGLWKYDGSWLRISHWDPKHMITWSASKLIVDFGQNGLYCYDGEAWERIAVPAQ